MWIKAEYQCAALATPHQGGPACKVRDAVTAGTLDAFATSESSARHAAWLLWRELLPHHRVDYVDVEHVQWQDSAGRYVNERVAYRFQGADLRGDSPEGAGVPVPACFYETRAALARLDRDEVAAGRPGVAQTAAIWRDAEAAGEGRGRSDWRPRLCAYLARLALRRYVGAERTPDAATLRRHARNALRELGAPDYLTDWQPE